MSSESSTSPGPDAGPPSPVNSSRPMSPAAASPNILDDDRVRRAAAASFSLRNHEMDRGFPTFFPHGPLLGGIGTALNLSSEARMSRGESRSSSFSSTNSHPLAGALNAAAGPPGNNGLRNGESLQFKFTFSFRSFFYVILRTQFHKPAQTQSHWIAT